jgi:phage terminase large subunit-like protein
MARQGTPEFPYRLDLSKAERFWRFAEKLKHYKGEWAGQAIVLEPWQKFITGNVFGWVHVTTDLRRFRTAFNEVPRKNGKTLIAAIVLLYLAFFDGESGAEGYAVATKRDQAKIVFNDAKQLVLSSGLKARVKVQVANMHRTDTASKLEPLGADHDSTDGLNPNAVVGDEIHAMKDRGMLDVMETATGARRQPVIYLITTFGNDLVSPWGDQHDYACKILDGVLQDETFFVFTSHADPEDDWTSEEAARKANPNFGISVNPDDLASKVVKAKGIPAAAATYKQKHLNLLVNAHNPCLSLDGWRKGQTKGNREAFVNALLGRRCYAGIDLASKIDLCALSLIFPPAAEGESFKLLQYIWTPEDTLRDRAHADRAPYDVWVDQGWLIPSPGTRVDHDAIRDVLREAKSQFQIEYVGFDPWHADHLIRQLVQDDGFSEQRVLEVPQTYAGMSSAETRFKAEVLAANVDANGCPVTAWAASNVVEQPDGKGNIFFTKRKSRGRIDPIKAATIGMALWLKTEPLDEPEYQVMFLGGRR